MTRNVTQGALHPVRQLGQQGGIVQAMQVLASCLQRRLAITRGDLLAEPIGKTLRVLSQPRRNESRQQVRRAVEGVHWKKD